MKEMFVACENELIICGPVYLADTFLKRLKGLMFKKSLADEEGLMFTKVSQVHTCFMRFPIDVIYLDAGFRVLDVETLQPWRIGRKIQNCTNLLEVNKGLGSRFKYGMEVEIKCLDDSEVNS